jgi:hypothetical protein
MINKGDQVFFIIGTDTKTYIAASDEYMLDGNLAVDLEGYEGEVGIQWLEILPF